MVTQAGVGLDPSARNRRFKPVRCTIEIAYIFASIKAITVKFLVWEKTTRKELYPIEYKQGIYRIRL